MGLNCCTLKVWTTIAVIYSIVNYTIFTVVDFFILLCNISPSTLSIGGNEWNQFIESFQKIDNSEIIEAVILIRLVLRLLIIISVPVLSIGNRRERRKYLIPWEITVSVYVAALIASSIYFLVVENKYGFISDLPDWIVGSGNLVHVNVGTTIQWARLTVFLNLSDGGPLLLIWLILLCLVHLRCVQIRFEKSQLRRLGQWDTNILTYRIPRARLNSLEAHPMDSTLELRSSRVPVFPNGPNVNDSHAPFYDNQAFKY